MNLYIEIEQEKSFTVDVRIHKNKSNIKQYYPRKETKTKHCWISINQWKIWKPILTQRHTNHSNPGSGSVELLQSLLDASRLVPPPSLLGAALAKAAEAKQRGTARCSAENHGEIMGKIQENCKKSSGNMIDMENHGNIMVEAMDKILETMENHRKLYFGNYGKIMGRYEKL